MDNALCMTMVDSLEQFLHIVGCFTFSECLILLLRDLVEQLLSLDVLHDQIHVLAVIISFKVLDNIWMIETIQNCYLFHNTVDIVSQLVLVEYFDGDLEVFLELICRHEHSSEGTNSEDFGLVVNNIVLLQLMYTLLLATLIWIDLLSVQRLLLLKTAILLFLA